MDKLIRIVTHDINGVVTKTEQADEEGVGAPTPGKKVKLDAMVGSSIVRALVDAKRKNPEITNEEMEALRAELVAESQ